MDGGKLQDARAETGFSGSILHGIGCGVGVPVPGESRPQSGAMVGRGGGVGLDVGQVGLSGLSLTGAEERPREQEVVVSDLASRERFRVGGTKPGNRSRMVTRCQGDLGRLIERQTIREGGLPEERGRRIGLGSGEGGEGDGREGSEDDQRKTPEDKWLTHGSGAAVPDMMGLSIGRRLCLHPCFSASA